MPLSWMQRLSHLCKILCTNIVTDDEERQGLALDRYLASRAIAGQGDVETFRFTDDDLCLVGKLAVGQFGTVDVVRCHLDSRVYVRKTIEKHTALRARGQCSPQLERDMLVKALRTNSLWAPHILCAFQTETALKLVMQYADGGNLWDVLESSVEGKISESDLKWWTPQMVSAIEWCHSQGFVHRDIKPHNFVLTPTSHLLLVDFGSAAPLLPPSPSGVQFVPKEHCLVPCGTCDYISPEVLQCHEEALVALEMEEDCPSSKQRNTDDNTGFYGRETDWWSFGAMLYELAFGTAPFFANDVGHTYIKIVEHRTSLKLSPSTNLSADALAFLAGLLCDKETRLGRHSVAEIKQHIFFNHVNWTQLHQRCAPTDLHLPQFTYSAGAFDKIEDGMTPLEEGGAEIEQFSQPFAFSALFQSSRSIPGVSPPREEPTHPSATSNRALESFVGFSWGPRLSAFNPLSNLRHDASSPQLVLHREPVNLTPRPTLPIRTTDPLPPLKLDPALGAFRTPVRTNSVPLMHGDTVSNPRTGTGRHMQGRRPVSDREAMQQLVDCVGMSARKKVLESGKKPAHIRITSGRSKEIQRFIPVPKPLAIDIGRKGNMSTSTSESESQPPSPTPRSGSALSRRSGWGGRSTPSPLIERSIPTLTFTTTGTEGSVAGNGTLPRGSNNYDMPPEDPNHTASYSRKLRDAERRHEKLLDELDTLGESIDDIALRLSRV